MSVTNIFSEQFFKSHGKSKKDYQQMHHCALPEDHAGLARLPPNAAFRKKFIRWFRKTISLNPRLGISKRNFPNKSQMNTEARKHASSKFFYIIHPYSSMEFYRQLMFTIITFWYIGVYLIYASFYWAALKQPFLLSFSYWDLTYTTRIIGALQIIWIISCFFTGYKKQYGKAVIQLNQLQIAKKYVMTYFLVDVIVLLLPIEYFRSRFPFFWINLIVAVRCPTLVKFYRRFLLDMKVPAQIITCIILFVSSFFIIHLCCCIFYVIPVMYTTKTRQPLWVVESRLQPNGSVSIIYMGVFTLVQSHFWGLGELNVPVENTMEEIVLIAVMIIGRIYSLYIIATLLRVLTVSSSSESKYDQYLSQLKTFISHNHLPKDMEDRLLVYYEYKFQHQFFNENAIVNSLSRYLKEELILFEAKSVVNKVHLFSFFPRSIIAAIIAKCKINVYMNHDYVIKRGDQLDYAYFVSSGTLAAYNDQNFEMIHLTDGDTIGIRAVTKFGVSFYTYTYIAVETTEMYLILVKDLRDILFAAPDVLKAFQKKVEERQNLWDRIEAVAETQGTDLLSELQNERVLERPRVRTRVFE